MHELQIPMKSLQVLIRMHRGEALDGLLYFTEDPYHHRPVELLLDALNDERQFLPFDVSSPCAGRAILNKAHIVAIVPDPSACCVEADPGDADAPCNLNLADGTTVAGVVRVATPLSASRITDKLNHASNFFPVVTDEGIVLIQRCQVTRVS